MTSIITVLSTVVLFIVSHLGGELVGTLLARFGLAGFGGAAGRTLRVGRALLKVYQATRGTRRNANAKKELLQWIQEHDPNRETTIARAYEADAAQTDPAKKANPKRKAK